MTAITKSNKTPVILQGGVCESEAAAETTGPDRHHMDPLNPPPLEARVHFYPTSSHRSETSSTDTDKRINCHW